MSDAQTVLNVQGVSKRFGGLQALSGVGLTIRRGQVYGLILSLIHISEPTRPY